MAKKGCAHGVCEGFGVFWVEPWGAVPSGQEHVFGVGKHQLLRDAPGEKPRAARGPKHLAGSIKKRAQGVGIMFGERLAGKRGFAGRVWNRIGWVLHGFG